MLKKECIIFIFVLMIILVCISFVSGARLPEVGGDEDSWGGILNEYLNVSLDENGSIKNDSIGDRHIRDNINLTIGQKITFSFNEMVDNLVDGWLRVTGGLNVTKGLEIGQGARIGGSLNVTGKIIADDWSDIQGSEIGNDLNWVNISQVEYSIGNWSEDKESYSTTAEILAFGYYNETDFVITDYFTKAEIGEFGYYNLSDFDIADYFTSAEVLAFDYYNSSDFDINDYVTSVTLAGYNYYNSSDFSISDYYNKTQVGEFGYYNLSDFDINDYATNIKVDSLGNWSDDKSDYWNKSENINVNINATGYNITADYFIGDGSQLTGVGSGNISGAGSANYVPLWTNENTLTNSSISDDGNTLTIEL